MTTALQKALAQAGYPDSLESSHPHLFSPLTVEISTKDLARLRVLIATIEQVVALPAYQAAALVHAPASAQQKTPAIGACTGYDFHLTPSGPQLIEINTNAGGALLALAQLRSHLSQEPVLQSRLPAGIDPAAIEKSFLNMFQQEWQAARNTTPLRTVAIVDDAPEQQFLYPEFVLYRELFRRHGIQAEIADPGSLTVKNGKLFAGELALDLVYNRVTDFVLAEPTHGALQQAWLEELAVITPHPRAHALYADKRNLVALTDADQLRDWGVAQNVIDTLQAGIPRTRIVKPADADSLWAERKQLFFKPTAGYGSKAVYRGDKITKRVWEEVLAADYVAQALAPPGEVTVSGTETLKFDLRVFVYRGEILLLTARLYQGQTTNFRTPGGGFAPVLIKEPT